MLKVKTTTYGAIPTKLTIEIKQAIQKIEEERKTKQNSQWLCKINSIEKKEYQKLALENQIL